MIAIHYSWNKLEIKIDSLCFYNIIFLIIYLSVCSGKYDDYETFDLIATVYFCN